MVYASAQFEPPLGGVVLPRHVQGRAVHLDRIITYQDVLEGLRPKLGRDQLRVLYELYPGVLQLYQLDTPDDHGAGQHDGVIPSAALCRLVHVHADDVAGGQ